MTTVKLNISERELRVVMKMNEAIAKVPNFITKGLKPEEMKALKEKAEKEVDEELN